ncbi:MAG: M20/M25/M40 family metallo-hydrolase [Anaerolineales bacterium]|nr:M20/M25/M40 family metallo-hydrolase [Anaerolineales bacterium]
MSEQAIQDLLELLPIPGPPAGESAVAAHIKTKLLALGIRPEQIAFDNAQAQSEYGGDCGNMIIQIPGKRPGPALMFSTHMDTVPDAVGCQPHLDAANERIVNDAPGKALGGDNRLGCAVLLHLVRQLLERRGDHPPIVVVFFVQEEVGLVGARGLDVSLLGPELPAMCFNLDGGFIDQFVTAVIGSERFTIDITGIPAHAGARPAQGTSAGIIAAEALAWLHQNGWHGRVEMPQGVGTANVGIIQGGQGSNVVMPALHILAEARSHDPAFRQLIIETWQEAFRAAAERVRNQFDQGGSVRFGPGPTYEAFALAPEAPVVKHLLAAADQIGLAATLVNNDGGMDANQIVAHGIPAITIGPGQRQVHTAEEWIHVPSFLQACELMVAAATINAGQDV